MNKILGLLGFGVVAAVGWSGCGHFKEQERKEAERQADLAERHALDAKRKEKLRLREWPFLPFAAAQLGETPARVPLVDHGTIEADAKALLREHNGVAVQRMFAGMERGEVGLSTKVLPGTLAYFAMERGKPTFSMSPNIVKQAKKSASLRLEAETIVEHEAWHYVQWLEADDAERKTYLPMRRRDVNIPAQCRRFWRNERDAYRKSCAYALQVGMPEFSNGTQQMCLRLGDEAAFDQYLFYANFIDGPTKDDMPECVPVWAELAGHPHPEAFAHVKPKKSKNE